MCAQDAVYHSDCLCQLYRDATRARMGDNVNDNDRKLHGIALSRILSYIDETRLATSETIPVFKLAELSKYYAERLEELGIINHKVQNARLKQRIIQEYDDMYAQNQGRDVILGFRSDLKLYQQQPILISVMKLVLLQKHARSSAEIYYKWRTRFLMGNSMNTAKKTPFPSQSTVYCHQSCTQITPPIQTTSRLF